MGQANNETYLDLGCGTTKKEDYYTGIDIHEYPGVNMILDLRMAKLPYDDNSVHGVYASHFLEHLTFEENVHLFNEVYRVLIPDKVFEIVVPHGMSYSGMADLSHKTFWTEDTFGYFTPQNTAHYDWKTDRNDVIINKWFVISNDATPKYQYTTGGFLEVKNREIHAFLQKK